MIVTTFENMIKEGYFGCNLTSALKKSAKRLHKNTLAKYPGENHPYEFWILYSVEKMKYLTVPGDKGLEKSGPGKFCTK